MRFVSFRSLNPFTLQSLPSFPSPLLSGTATFSHMRPARLPFFPLSLTLSPREPNYSAPNGRHFQRRSRRIAVGRAPFRNRTAIHLRPSECLLFHFWFRLETLQTLPPFLGESQFSDEMAQDVERPPAHPSHQITRKRCTSHTRYTETRDFVRVCFRIVLRIALSFL